MSATQKFIRKLFAQIGDKAAVPDLTAGDGSVSYEQGYAFDYQRAPVDPLWKPIERDKFNQVLYDLSLGIHQYQVQGVPEFIESADNGGAPYSYDIGARVKWTDGCVYVSIAAANVAAPSDATKWRRMFDRVLSGTAAGTGDAITVAAVGEPVVAAYAQMQLLLVKLSAANTVVAPTINVNTLGAKTIVKGANQLLVPGDLSGTSGYALFAYDVGLDKFVLLNPATQTRGPVLSVTAAANVPVNALTVTIEPAMLDFRNPTLSNGVTSARTIPATLSLVVPSGATLGMLANNSARIAILALDVAGVVDIAVANGSGMSLDETGVITTTAMTAASDSANVAYSAVARVGVGYRVAGFLDVAQAVPGTWVTAPTRVQGAGGASLSSMFGLGNCQTVQNLSGSRSPNVGYYNTTGRPIFVEVSVNIAAGGSVNFQRDGLITQNVGNNTAVTTAMTVASIVQPNQLYAVNVSGGPSYTWTETR